MIKTRFIFLIIVLGLRAWNELKTRIVKLDTIMGYGKNGICQGNLPTGCNQR